MIKYDFFGLGRLYLDDKQLVEKKEASSCDDDDDRMREEGYHKSKTLYINYQKDGMEEGSLTCEAKDKQTYKVRRKVTKQKKSVKEFDLGKR